MTAQATRAVQILLVEDNPGDVELTREAFAESQVASLIDVACDAETALAFLHREGAYLHAPRPDLILLDLNLPGRNGQEVLAMVKSDPQLRSIPVIVLSSSQADDDIASAYQLLANCYVAKPVGYGHFSEIVRAIEQFWFVVARLPNRA